MKKSFKLGLQVGIAFFLLTGSGVYYSANLGCLISEANASVSYQVAYNALVSRGYTVISLVETPEKANEDWIGDTWLQGIHYESRVIVSGTQVIGVESTPL